MQSLRLTRPWPEDVEAIAAAMADWETARWLTVVPYPYAEADARAFIEEAGPDEYAIRMGEGLVGMLRLGDSFGIWMAPGWQGRGIARRAALLAFTRFFAAGADGIGARYLDGNDRSAKLLDWLGFRPVERLQINSRPLGRDAPAQGLHLSRGDFEARHSIAIDTPRLRIDAVRPDDMEALHRIVTRPEVARMLLRFHPDMSVDEVTQILTDGALTPPLRLAVRHAGRVIGAVGLSAGTVPRLSYFLDPEMAGQGIGQEMVAASFAEIVARLDPPQIEADVFLDNLPSRNVLKNLGFRRSEDVAITSLGRNGPDQAALYRWRPGTIS
ncbi:GNAT family N-acetyltransferase [Paracoccus sp. 1_MG-2023]|uniref:GNAT family N-acetyltransferase n=1 Tax=unclassified Paracoccus (in: a-proteobacteria) TaxID=2688777 RepID=UPI001C0999F4|nr:MULTISPECIES: GNAT family N-acetyltransferase [unclassified Paracoccus (in: a-proteobacteria)]MDO6668393.1 GNAT family N-acetyltransferase [Paracoccus sp. 1_MG-2023]